MTTATRTSAPTTCLLHADVHVMGKDCWAHTTDWYFTNDHLDQHEARDAYQSAVERAMLDQFARQQAALPPDPFYGRKTSGHDTGHPTSAAS